MDMSISSSAEAEVVKWLRWDTAENEAAAYSQSPHHLYSSRQSEAAAIPPSRPLPPLPPALRRGSGFIHLFVQECGDEPGLLHSQMKAPAPSFNTILGCLLAWSLVMDKAAKASTTNGMSGALLLNHVRRFQMSFALQSHTVYNHPSCLSTTYTAMGVQIFPLAVKQYNHPCVVPIP